MTGSLIAMCASLFLSFSLFMGAFLYKNSLENHSDEYAFTRAELQKNIQKKQTQLRFVENNRAEYQDLTVKGWEVPHTRLQAGKYLEKCAEDNRLNSFYYTFSPEKDEGIFNKTRVSVDVTGVLDEDVMSYFQSIREKFPGIIEPLSLSLSRYQSLTQEALEELRQGQTQDFVFGTFVFDWVSLGENDA